MAVYFLNDCLLFLWCYFPASGYRRGEIGSFVNIGLGGYSWLSSIGGVDLCRGASLDFLIAGILPLNTSLRAISLPVRCVQESLE